MKKLIYVFGAISMLFSCGGDDEESVNLAPIIVDQSFTVDENINDQDVIGNVVATDPESDEINFSILENSKDLFRITNSGILSLSSGSNLNFSEDQSHELTIEVSDGEKSSNAKITVNVRESSVNIPPSIDNQILSVSENISQTDLIGIIEATDDNDDNLTYLIIEDSDDLFEISIGGELTLKDKRKLDFETKTSHNIEVQVSDGLEESSAQITINVNDFDETKSFITTWEVQAAQTINLPIYQSTSSTNTDYDFVVDWGDGTSSSVTSFNDSDASHTFSEGGEFEIILSGTIAGFNFSLNDLSATNFKDVNQWGNLILGNDGGVFMGCDNLETFSATDVPDLSEISDLSLLFAFATKFNGDIADWDVSSITNMAAMFRGASSFNGDISGWDVNNVTDMSVMFFEASSFNQDIGAWNVESVTNTAFMFSEASSFNQDISNWNVSMVTSMPLMFSEASSFNQNIGSWNVENVTDMSFMFSGASSFNQDLNNWNVGKVTNMNGMFQNANSFNENIGGWNVGSVTDMSFMFSGATMFNQNLNNWNTSEVTDMAGMFLGATAFNENISGWNVSSVTDMSFLFSGAESFNQDIAGWNLMNVTTSSAMFQDATSFNQNIGGWDVSSITDMSFMFSGALSFNQDIGGWNVENVTDMSFMFQLAEIFNQDLSGWNTNSVTDCEDFALSSGLSVPNLPTQGCFE